MGNWAELQEDLLILIAKRIDQLEDFLAFGRVCRSWRSVAAVRQNFIGSQQIPWLMLAEEEEDDDKSSSSSRDERRFCSLIKGEGNMVRKVMLPEARGKRCMESLGWFLTIAEDGDMNLLHPFSRVQIGLPHITTFKYHEYGNMRNNFMFIQKAVLSSSPSHSRKDFVLMVIYEGCGFLGFWRPGDRTWTTIETREGAYRDIAYYKGQFYGVDTQGKVFVCDVGGPDPTLARFVGGIPGVFLMFKRPYIVESAGALLIVVRDGYDLNFLTDDEEEDLDLDYDNLDESTIDYGTNEFRVFELDLSNQRWTELNSLGDKALFVGHSASISVDEASKFPGIRTNCIYYTDDCWGAYGAFKRGGGKDMGIYNLEDGSRTPCYKGRSFSPICPPIWVTPSFF